MAIQPYERKIGVPESAGGGVSRIVDTRVADIGPSIQRLGETLLRTYEPVLQDKALERAKEDAGALQLERGADGQLTLPDRAQDGGMIYRKAFDQIIEARYLNQVGTSFQTFLDNEVAARRAGEKPFDPKCRNMDVAIDGDRVLVSDPVRWTIEIFEPEE